VNENIQSEPRLPAIHPGEILREEFLKPLAITPEKLAKDAGLSSVLVQEILIGSHPITQNAALKLSRYFKLSERFWINLQARYDREIAKD
jgi:addiction module HigA family antidote